VHIVREILIILFLNMFVQGNKAEEDRDPKVDEEDNN
jgi:hypothetical protein